MSFDPTPQPAPGFPTPDTPFGTPEPPKKSNRKWWFLGCGGCLFFVIFVCGGGGAFFYFQYMKPAQDFLTESVALASESEAVKEALGEPVEIGAPEQPTSTSSGNMVTLEYRFPISGPDGEGTLVIEGLYDLKTWERKEFYIEVDGERINIDEDQFNIEIDGGDSD